MSTLAHTLPTPRLVSADVLKLRKRRGLAAVVALMTVGTVIIANAVIELMHLSREGDQISYQREQSGRHRLMASYRSRDIGAAGYICIVSRVGRSGCGRRGKLIARAPGAGSIQFGDRALEFRDLGA